MVIFSTVKFLNCLLNFDMCTICVFNREYSAQGSNNNKGDNETKEYRIGMVLK